MPCTKDDSDNTATTHEDCEENTTFNLEEENDYKKNEVSSIFHEEEHMGTKKDVDNTIQDESAKNTTTNHKEEHMCTKKDVDNTILDEFAKNTATTHEKNTWVLQKIWMTPSRMSE